MTSGGVRFKLVLCQGDYCICYVYVNNVNFYSFNMNNVQESKNLSRCSSMDCNLGKCFPKSHPYDDYGWDIHSYISCSYFYQKYNCQKYLFCYMHYH